MSKAKTFKLLPLVMLSSVVLAETNATHLQAASTENATVNHATSDAILPQLSFSAQQARAAELAKRADYVFEQEQIRLEEERNCKKRC
ncbi:Uncharacterised protein [Actinobacillus pleuropneumoniae]|nr:Uncharacterised protein [Actinobacillus pleuropneumoniae]